MKRTLAVQSVKIEPYQSRVPIASCAKCESRFAIFEVMMVSWTSMPETPSRPLAVEGKTFRFCPGCGAKLEGGGFTPPDKVQP